MRKREEQKSKKNNGITLIALVITIIVLLILAGVTIATLTGENGILTRATDAKTNTEVAEEKEAISLAYSGVMADTNGTGVTAEKLQTELQNNGYTNAKAVDNGDGTITVTFESGREYTIDANGSITGPTVSNITATMKIVGEKVETPPLPSSDFKHIEGTVDTGYVIQDSDGNEFVWVPVNKNQKIQINVTSKENIENIILTDPYGDNIELSGTDNLGTSYSNENVTPTINGPYVLKVTTATEEKTVILGVHSLYAIDTMADWFFTEEVALAKGAPSLEEFLGMPLEEAYVEYAKRLNKYTESNDSEGIKCDKNSVEAKGGFYIGRYEASEENGSVAIKKNKQPWNDVSQIEALEKSKEKYPDSDFTSSLLTGAAWDRTLGWLEETGAVTSFKIVGDSKTWGNYNDDTFLNTTGLINTGSMTETKANNIYDLAGNLWEWTTEADGADNRVYRGR